ncbi:ABC transporter permease [Negadavirga shengliensis]|uniref:ABC transporter permease n=1 Tax=Negadavirga shengliensis TaxID=1389218 RepID=A0ABV9T765_9BACT
MWKNYLKIAYRNLRRQWGYSLINIGGLAVGMALAILIGLWIYDELSFNKYHKNYHRIARVMQNQTFDGEVVTWGSQAVQLGPELRNSYGSNFEHVVISSFTRSPILTFGEKALAKTGNFMEADAPGMLSLKMLKGTHAGLKDPYTILLSESTAKAFFGDSDPVGEILKMDSRLDVKVTGVYEDLPHNSTFKDLNFIAPWDLMVKSENLEERVGWGNSWFQAFVQVAENVDMAQASLAIKEAKQHNVGDEDKRFNPELFLHPMAKWHLYSQFENGISVGGKITFVWLFGIIGGFVLLLACINFMNLSTARSEKRAKEVGIRKVVGSFRSQLINQFFGESLVVTALAFALSILLVQLALPWFNEVADKQMTVLWTSPLFWLTGIGFTFFTGLVAGSYPAFYLSAFRPIKVLKSTFRTGRFGSIPRKALVVVQFTVSITLIIGTIIVFQQIQHAKNRPVGYDRKGLITIPIKTEEIRNHYEAFRNDLLASGTIAEAALSESTIINTGVTNSGFEWKGKDPNMQDEIVTGGVNHEFGKTVGWKIKEGRDFSRDFATDSSGFILNETAVKYMGLENPIGETVKAFGGNYTIIGVVEDIVTQSLYQPVRQTIFYIDTFNRIKFINIKINPQVSAGKAIAEIESIFKKHHPATPFEYQFADEEFAAKFLNEERIGRLAGFFAILAVFISCLGLFGLASFVAEQRTKEIGIRKILGASVATLWGMLSSDFVVLVMISCFIAIPVSYFYLNGWLLQYEYRIGIAWWVFVVAGAGALAIAVLTVSFQSIRAALANPVESLRSE